MKITTVLTLMALSLLTACSTAGALRAEEADKEKLARYTAYAGEPVSQFNMYTHFDSWSQVDDDHVVIHTNVNQAYLVRVVPPCIDLPFATRLGVTSRFPNTVQSGFDSIRVGRESCRILEIRPLNYKKMQADLAEEKKLRG